MGLTMKTLAALLLALVVWSATAAEPVSFQGVNLLCTQEHFQKLWTNAPVKWEKPKEGFADVVGHSKATVIGREINASFSFARAGESEPRLVMILVEGFSPQQGDEILRGLIAKYGKPAVQTAGVARWQSKDHTIFFTRDLGQLPGHVSYQATAFEEWVKQERRRRDL
jgi:hypothetical protein